MIDNFLFYVVVAFTALAALYILFARRIIYAALALALCLFNTALLFSFVGSEFIALTQILIYIGGVVVLIVFAIMYTNKENNLIRSLSVRNLPFGILIGISLASLLIYDKPTYGTIEKNAHSIDAIGIVLLTRYGFIFEWCGILLLVCLVGVVYTASFHSYTDHE